MTSRGAIRAGKADSLSAILIWTLLAGYPGAAARRGHAQQSAASGIPASAALTGNTGTVVQGDASPELTLRNPRYVIQCEDGGYGSEICP